MFELTDQPLDQAALRARLPRAEAGACVVFEGWVRNHHLGRPVVQLEYEAFDTLTRLEGEAITGEAEQTHPGCRVLCVHRTGRLAIGELAVWIGATAPHREQGFAACRQVIEELKLRLPIWKKEHHPDGAAEWVNCTAEAAARPAAIPAQQMALPEVGEAGQARLGATRVLIVGVGGLGCPAALYLAGAGLGQLTLVDGGKVERQNLQRQILFTTAEEGATKVLAGAARLRLLNPAVRITPHEGDLTLRNALTLVAGHDVVLDCTDNFATRFLLHDACQALGVPLVQAAVHRFEGTLDVFQRGAGGCLHCLWLGRGAGDLEAAAGSCAGGAVFGPAVGVLGVMQAAEAIKLLLGRAGDSPGQTRLINLLDGTQLNIARKARPDCPACARLEQLLVSAATDAPADRALMLDGAGVAALGPSARSIRLFEPGEPPPSGPAALQSVAANNLVRLRELAATGPLVLECRHGVRSAALARLLRAEGLANVYARPAASG